MQMGSFLPEQRETSLSPLPGSSRHRPARTGRQGFIGRGGYADGAGGAGAGGGGVEGGLWGLGAGVWTPEGERRRRNRDVIAEAVTTGLDDGVRTVGNAAQGLVDFFVNIGGGDHNRNSSQSGQQLSPSTNNTFEPGHSPMLAQGGGFPGPPGSSDFQISNSEHQLFEGGERVERGTRGDHEWMEAGVQVTAMVPPPPPLSRGRAVEPKVDLVLRPGESQTMRGVDGAASFHEEDTDRGRVQVSSLACRKRTFLTF